MSKIKFLTKLYNLQTKMIKKKTNFKIKFSTTKK